MATNLNATIIKLATAIEELRAKPGFNPKVRRAIARKRSGKTPTATCDTKAAPSVRVTSCLDATSSSDKHMNWDTSKLPSTTTMTPAEALSVLGVKGSDFKNPEDNPANYLL